MSDHSSMDEQMDDGLTIKPPQAYPRGHKDRKHSSRSHRHSSKSSRSNKEFPEEERERRRGQHQHKHHHHDRSKDRRVDRMDRDPLLRHDVEKDRSRQPKRYDDIVAVDRERQSSSSRRHGGLISGLKDKKTVELSETKLKRMQLELENEKAMRDIERRREKEKVEASGSGSSSRHRDRGDRDRDRKEKSRRHRRTPSPSPPPPPAEEEELDERVTLEVQEIDESGSDLEEGEERSPPEPEEPKPESERSNVSSVSDHDQHNEPPGPGPSEKKEKTTSDVSSTTSSSRKSHSDGRSEVSSSSSSSSSSDSGEEGEHEEQDSKGGNDDGEDGPTKAKLFRHDSPPDEDSYHEEDPNEERKSSAQNSNDTIPSVVVTPVEEEEEDLLPPYFPALQGCRRVEEFSLLNRIEEGTYGVVYRAKEKRTDEVVALKRLKMEKEKDGFPITSLREINTLLKAQHENIVTVREIVVGSNTDKIFLVMDYVEHDLKALMETLKHKNQVFLIEEVKCLMVQLLRAVAHMHDNWILHRDLKTSNLLLSHKGILKVGDFGLAREYGSPLKGYTPIVVTLWYRAPELLLGTKEYSTPIDVWSVGCIFGELLKMEPMFPGKTEPNQLNLIFQSLGTPNDRIWPGYSQLPLLQKMTFADYPVNKLKTRFGHLTDMGIDLMNKFLTFNPAKRITAEDALDHKFFKEIPIPINPEMFPTWPAKSEGGHRKAAASPKPPSGGKEFKGLDEDSAGFFLGGQDARRPPMGAGFSLKF